MKRFKYLLPAILLFSCVKDDKDDSIPEAYYSGGETTITSSGPDAFTFPSANLDQEGLTKHFEADAVFGQQFVSAPSSQAGGVGPLFNQNSCEGCHIRNGRGIIPQYEGDTGTGLLLRLSMPGLNVNGLITKVPHFGGQLQTKAIIGTEIEGRISQNEISRIVRFVDGTEILLTKNEYGIADPYMSLPASVLLSPRMPPPVHGLGLIDAITEESILFYEDINDVDNDGISGKANMVWDVLANKLSVGRFGWKAEQPTAGQQAADAAHNDMGLTNFYFPEEQCEGQENCVEGLQNINDIDDEMTDLMAFYFETIGVPARRNMDDSQVKAGENLFESIKCASCHVPRYVTGMHEISELSNQTIFPYTDLLLHDMGEELADGRPTFLADGREWRTAPLWGIGLTQVVNSKATFLHDGRAHTLEEAILWHGGEAESSRDAYMALEKDEREALLSFLGSL